MKIPDLGPRVRFAAGDDRARAGRYYKGLPPLFEITSATRALAVMAHIGPLAGHLISDLRPRIPLQRTTDVLDRYVEAGLLVTFIVKALNGQPRVWGLNRGHENFWAFDALCKALWKHYVADIFTTVPSSPYRVPIEERRDATGGLALMHREGFRCDGEIVHLLAEFRQPVEQAIVRDLLGYGGGDHFCHRVSALVARGLLAEEYRGIERFISLNFDNPIVGPLRWWIGYVNRKSETQYGELAETYRRERDAGMHLLATRRWRSRNRSPNKDDLPLRAPTGRRGRPRKEAAS